VGALLMIAALVKASLSRPAWILFKLRWTRYLTVLLGVLVLWALASRR
jgi:hypothetical protein